jgi:hypothetical protein
MSTKTSTEKPDIDKTSDDQESKDKGIVKPLVEKGLPPGISPEQAKDPGNAVDGRNGYQDNS